MARIILKMYFFIVKIEFTVPKNKEKNTNIAIFVWKGYAPLCPAYLGNANGKIMPKYISNTFFNGKNEFAISKNNGKHINIVILFGWVRPFATPSFSTALT